MAIENRIDLLHLQDRPLNQYQLRVKTLDKQTALPTGLTMEDVDALWGEQIKANPNRKNLPRFFLDGIEGNELRLTLGNYAMFVASRDMKKAATSPYQLEEILNTGLSVLGLIVIAKGPDGSILVQERSMGVEQGKGKYCLPAGGYMPGHFPEGEYPNPFASAARQLEQEQHMHIDPSQLRYLGIARELIDGDNPTMIFKADTAYDRDQLRTLLGLAKDKWETSSLRFIDSESTQLMRVLHGKTVDNAFLPGSDEGLIKTILGEYVDADGRPLERSFLGVSMGALLAYGRSEYGNEWFSEAKKVALHNPDVPLREIRTIDYR